MKKLLRSRNNRVIAGVCGGFAEYFNIDPVIVRILWFIFTIISMGMMILLYIACMLIIPEDNGIIYQDDDSRMSPKNNNTPLFVGGGLIIIGSYMIAKMYFPRIHVSIRSLLKFWPIILILLGLYILINHKNSR